MGTALYIVLDKEEPGFDTFVNGKVIAKELKRLDAISRKIGIPRFEDFLSMSTDEIEGLLGDEVELPEMGVKWFTPEEGLAFIEAMSNHVRQNPASVKDQSALLDELAEYTDILGKAKAIGSKWRLNMDI